MMSWRDQITQRDSIERRRSTMQPRKIVQRLLERQVTPFIAAHRQTLPVRSLARCCARFLDAYHNVNHESTVNGDSLC